jgi:hypothetical protein
MQKAHIKLTSATAALAALSACAVLPDTVTPTLEHMSHATQHAPFTAHPTEYGANIAQLEAGWTLAPHLTLTLAEGIALDRRYPGTPSTGELMGPNREQFTGRIGYTFNIRK